MPDEQKVIPSGPLGWSAPESHFFEKTSTWYIASAIIAGIIVVLSLWQGNFLFVVFTVIAEILVLFWANQPPRTVTYELNNEGFILNDRLFRYGNLSGFALVESLGGPHYYELVLKQKQPLAPYIKALVPNEGANEVSEFLSARLQEFPYTPSIAEALMNRIGL